MGQPELTSAPEAFAAVALAAIAADGELSAVEARALRQQLEYRQPFRRLSDQDMGALLDRVLLQLRASSCAELILQATPSFQWHNGKRPWPLRPTSFTPITSKPKPN